MSIVVLYEILTHTQTRSWHWHNASDKKNELTECNHICSFQTPEPDTSSIRGVGATTVVFVFILTTISVVIIPVFIL